MGYGEDSLTLWALKNRLSVILDEFSDRTPPSECFALYRPSFGRAGGKGSSEFGEFDAILVSRKNVYLIESKWSYDSSSERQSNKPKPVQKLRHDVFSWYLTHWSREYVGHWDRFLAEQDSNLKRTLQKRVPATRRILSRNLEFILSKILDHCTDFSGASSIKNVLLLFYSKTRPRLDVEGFIPVFINTAQQLGGNFIRI